MNGPADFEEPSPNVFAAESPDNHTVQDDLALALFMQARNAYSMGHIQAIDPIVYHAQARTLLAAGWRPPVRR